MSVSFVRLDVTVNLETAKILVELAKKSNQAVSTLANELITEALEQREDIALSALAKKRDSKSHKKISHQDVWV